MPEPRANPGVVGPIGCGRCRGRGHPIGFITWEKAGSTHTMTKCGCNGGDHNAAPGDGWSEHDPSSRVTDTARAKTDALFERMSSGDALVRAEDRRNPGGRRAVDDLVRRVGGGMG